MAEATLAPPGTTCPTCGLDVAGYAERTVGGRRAWDRPARWETTQTGNEVMSGGFTHIEGGTRCRPEPVASAATNPEGSAS